MTLGPGQLHLMSMAKQKTRDKWALTPADHTAKSERPPTLCRGTLHTEGLCKNCPVSFILLSRLLRPVFKNYYYAFLFIMAYLNASDLFSCSGLDEIVGLFSDPPRPSGSYLYPSNPAMRMNPCEYKSCTSILKSSSVKHFSRCWIVQPNSMDFSSLDKMASIHPTQLVSFWGGHSPYQTKLMGSCPRWTYNINPSAGNCSSRQIIT